MQENKTNTLEFNVQEYKNENVNRANQLVSQIFLNNSLIFTEYRPKLAKNKCDRITYLTRSKRYDITYKDFFCQSILNKVEKIRDKLKGMTKETTLGSNSFYQKESFRSNELSIKDSLESVAIVTAEIPRYSTKIALSQVQVYNSKKEYFTQIEQICKEAEQIYSKELNTKWNIEVKLMGK